MNNSQLLQGQLIWRPTIVLEQVKIIDLFAGAGGLGEGFASWSADGSKHPYSIVASVEKDKEACETLSLRAFFRKFTHGAPKEYYNHLAGDISEAELYRLFPDEWQRANSEILRLELGVKKDNRYLQKQIALMRSRWKKHHWILLGGPPCQAYSTAGRGRLQSVAGYSLEADPRSFLYKQYLGVVKSLSPSVFVLENVKGLLSVAIEGKKLFPKILRDLASAGDGYKIHSLSSDFVYSKGDKLNPGDFKKFLVNSEDYGIPQNRHRVFLVGLREDLNIEPFFLQSSKHNKKLNVFDVLSGLPKIRSGLSKSDNRTNILWKEIFLKNLLNLRKICSNTDAIVNEINSVISDINEKHVVLQIQSPKGHIAKFQKQNDTDLKDWFIDNRLYNTPNHTSRSHMSSDLMRYVFCSIYAKLYGYSPKSQDFPRELAPNHASWISGDFSDRFRVQISDAPSTTVTSHIACDGHYFIHYDPLQCRTLSVREAARLQTFPDNFFFKGYRTHQYMQVGNAVPPLLANQIAGALWSSLERVL